MDFATLFTASLAFATILGNALFLVVFAIYFSSPEIKRKINVYVLRYGTVIWFLLAGSSTVGSLVYSQVVGFPACILCWTQRIFMYPQMFMFLFAWIKNDKSVFRYALLLSLLGGGVALYHWIKDMLAIYAGVLVPCPAVTSLPSCDKIYVFEYGYITIPMIALNAFLWITFLSWVGLNQSNREA
jgi:disulfide bond formation protein DsbB